VRGLWRSARTEPLWLQFLLAAGLVAGGLFALLVLLFALFALYVVVVLGLFGI
jgi:hypothetical protein